jgi:hypothetical protein
MKMTHCEKKLLIKRLNELKSYLALSLRNNRLDNYLNAVNSREVRLIEGVIFRSQLSEMKITA